MFKAIKDQLKQKPYTWLITGVAGFIGSNLLETLLKLDQKVIGFDNFSTGYQKNLDAVLASVLEAQRGYFTFIEGDIRSEADCQKAVRGVDYVLHQAALASVPRSIQLPELVNEVNVGGFLRVLKASVDANVKRFVYASSSSVYGDSPELPKVEDKIGNLLSPYAATKRINELYAEVFSRCYGIETIGLRYFNVFGPRQDPTGAYAAVIPLWFSAVLRNESPIINGDGETSRDFCYIDNIVQANILSATTKNEKAVNQSYNIAVGERTTLNQLAEMITNILSKEDIAPKYVDFREGDIRHSLADINKAKNLLGYSPQCTVVEGIRRAKNYYCMSSVSRG